VKRYRNFEQRVLVSGFSDLGVMFPYGVGRFTLTDRADGTKWLVSWNTDVTTSDGFGYITITNDFTLLDHGNGERNIEYGPDEGPLLNNGQYMLMIRGRRLGVDYRPFPPGVTDASTSVKPYAQKHQVTPRLIYFNPSGKFAWTPEFKQ